MVSFEETLDNLEASGYTVLSVETPMDNPDARIVTLKDSTGAVLTKKYIIVLNPVTDPNTGEVVDVAEDCVEVA